MTVGLKAGKPSASKQAKTLSAVANDEEMSRYTCDLPKAMHKALKMQAIEEERDAVEIIRELLGAYLRKNGKLS